MAEIDISTINSEELLHIVDHELSQKLTIIKSYLLLLDDEKISGQLNQNQEDFLSGLSKEVEVIQKISLLIREWLDTHGGKISQ